MPASCVVDRSYLVAAAQSGSGRGKDGQPKRDPDGGWHVKRDSRGRQKSTYGFSVHTGVDESALVVDAAYSSKAKRDQLARLGILGIDGQVQRKAGRGKPLSREDLQRNKNMAVVRAGSVEKGSYLRQCFYVVVIHDDIHPSIMNKTQAGSVSSRIGRGSI